MGIIPRPKYELKHKDRMYWQRITIDLTFQLFGGAVASGIYG